MTRSSSRYSEKYQFKSHKKYCELNEIIVQKMFSNGPNSFIKPPHSKPMMKPWLMPLSQSELNMASNLNDLTAELDEKKLKSPRTFPCPDCEKDFNDPGTVYGHHKRVHGTEAWLRFRLRIIPGLQEFKCSECLFVFERPSVRHECESYQKILSSYPEIRKEDQSSGQFSKNENLIGCQYHPIRFDSKTPPRQARYIILAMSRM